MDNIQPQHVIITGGSRGIGLAVAQAFLARGAKVLAVARSGKGSKTPVHECDVSDANEVEKLAPIIERELEGRVDVLVNAAGIYGPIGLLEENDAKLWRKTFEINVFGTMHLCRLVIPYMKKQKSGCIINFSGGGEGPFPRFTAYSSSKGAILRFTESVAEELREWNITVNAVAPGAVNTALLAEVIKVGEEKVGKEFYQKSLVQKESGGTPPKLAAELILFLASLSGRGITGKMLSAVHDKIVVLKKHGKEIEATDIYNVRRIKPKDRGMKW